MEKLIERARARDKDAFATLMQIQKQTMYRTARAILMNDEDVADAIQDTVLTCWEKIDTLREPDYFKTWLTRILINKCKDVIRRNHGVVYVEELPDAGLLGQAGNVSFDDTMRWKEALAVLPEKFRLVIALYYGEGFETGEIAACLKIPKGTVRSRLARGREILKNYYSDQETAVNCIGQHREARGSSAGQHCGASGSRVCGEKRDNVLKVCRAKHGETIDRQGTESDSSRISSKKKEDMTCVRKAWNI
ncbi:MAG: sigma-70 family RNA polymerase sigma factor [Lachnospiraceae bacterium]|nr:sigma-70 family RNA polymerase sigma factor [Lachnospiraceae bacterium]